MTDQAHMDAVLDRMRAETVLATRTHDTVFPEGTDLSRSAYALVFLDLDAADDDRMSRRPDIDSTREYAVTVRGIATDAQGARAVLRHARNQLVGAVLNVPGRRCDPLRMPLGTGITVDNNVRPPLVSVDDEYLLISRRGGADD